MEMWANISCKFRVLGSVASKIEACSVCWEGFWWAKGALGDPWGAFEEHLGILGVIWGPLGALGDSLGDPWDILGVLDCPWGPKRIKVSYFVGPKSQNPQKP